MYFIFAPPPGVRARYPDAQRAINAAALFVTKIAFRNRLAGLMIIASFNDALMPI